MGYIDLIPDVFRLTMPDLATGKSYHTQKFNVGNKQCIGVTIKASQALSVAVAYGIATDTAAAAGVDIAASLPYKTSATSFASNTSTEGGTYHEIAVPPHARQAQLVISNASGSTVSGAVIDAALRVVAYPAASGSGSSDFASITGWPGSSSQFVHADGSYSPLSAADIPVFWVATTTRSTNAFSGSLPTTPTLATGLVIRWQVPSAPSGAATYNLNGLGAKNIYARGSANTAADLPANRIVTMIYDGTQWQMIACNTLVPGDMPRRDMLHLTRSTNQTGMATGDTETTILWDTVAANEGSRWTYNSGTGVATCVIAGRYSALLQVHQTTTTASGTNLRVKKASTTIGQVYAGGANTAAPVLQCLGTADYQVGDTISTTLSAGTSNAPVLGASLSYLKIQYEGASS